MSEEPTPEEAGSAEPMEGQSTAQAALPDAPKTSFVSGEDHVAEVKGKENHPKPRSPPMRFQPKPLPTLQKRLMHQNLKPRVLSLKTNQLNR